MQLRDLTAADVGVVTAINAANVPAVGEASESRIAELLGMSTIALGAVAGAGLVGFCLVLGPGAAYSSVNYRWFSERYDDFAYLDRVAIAEAYRNRGIGTAIYAELDRRVTAPWLTLEVNLRPRNDGSLRFHERLGFTEVGQQETDYGVRVSLMRREMVRSASS